MKCELEGLAKLNLKETTRLNVKARFSNGETHDNLWIDRKEEVDVPGGKGTVLRADDHILRNPSFRCFFNLFFCFLLKKRAVGLMLLLRDSRRTFSSSHQEAAKSLHRTMI
uniref:Uncharacterized protein n=1 Tax=Lotharella globosa TaxID=91324 RepID=A0A6V3KWH1_9EUKA|mmetsp:Transcript_14830/g.27973  ORF Transcript_14830/g.27973 Transcript_14830/m.27973 type:complete len:111 (-) Transcript_14830:595-927(-)